MIFLQRKQVGKLFVTFLLLCILSVLSVPPVDAEYSILEQYNLGLERYNAGDYESAAYWFNQAAEKGEADAQYNLAWMYDNGKGVKQDYATAVYWYTKAAEQGNADAQFNLALMYFKGEGVPQNYINSYAWINLAASHSDEQALKYKGEIAASLSPQQLAEAQQITADLQCKIYNISQTSKNNHTDEQADSIPNWWPFWITLTAFAVVSIFLAIVSIMQKRKAQQQRAVVRPPQDEPTNAEIINLEALQNLNEPGGETTNEASEMIDVKLVSDFRRSLDTASTEELSRAYTDHNDSIWAKEAFEAMRQILLARAEAIKLESLQSAASRPPDPGPATPAGTQLLKAGTKKCPFCAEEIKAEAIKCRFCREFLNAKDPSIKGKDYSTTSKPPSKSEKTVKMTDKRPPRVDETPKTETQKRGFSGLSDLASNITQDNKE